MFKKNFLSVACSAALVGAVAAPAYASTTFHLVVPLTTRQQAQQPPVDSIAVSLAGAALRKATVNQAYSESLRPYLVVTGDAAFDPAAARWRLVNGALPTGLALNSFTGQIAGTPSSVTQAGASFDIAATYKGKSAQQTYTLQVAKTSVASCKDYLQANPGAPSGWYTSKLLLRHDLRRRWLDAHCASDGSGTGPQLEWGSKWPVVCAINSTNPSAYTNCIWQR